MVVDHFTGYVGFPVQGQVCHVKLCVDVFHRDGGAFSGGAIGRTTYDVKGAAGRDGKRIAREHGRTVCAGFLKGDGKENGAGTAGRNVARGIGEFKVDLGGVTHHGDTLPSNAVAVHGSSAVVSDPIRQKEGQFQIGDAVQVLAGGVHEGQHQGAPREHVQLIVPQFEDEMFAIHRHFQYQRFSAGRRGHGRPTCLGYLFTIEGIHDIVDVRGVSDVHVVVVVGANQVAALQTDRTAGGPGSGL